MAVLPHDPYITAVVDALTAAGLEPYDAWTSDAEIDQYDTGPDAGCTTQLGAVLTWTGDHPAADTDELPGGMVLVWEHPAEEWLYAERQTNGVFTMAPEFVPGLPRWADPAGIVATVRELLAGRKPGDTPAALWDGAAEAQTAVDTWAVKDGGVMDELERLRARVAELETELAALKTVTPGYCPACGRGDCAPSADDWYTQWQRADKADARLAAALEEASPAVCDLPHATIAEETTCDRAAETSGEA